MPVVTNMTDMLKGYACCVSNGACEANQGLPVQEHPDVPVVTNMEDMWKVSKLQRERERKADAAAKAQARKEAVESATKGKEGKGSPGGPIDAADLPSK